jgi:DNA-binding GntR family transcriptional regulator
MTDERHDRDVVDALEEILARLERAVEERLPLARQDRLEADRLFVFAGDVDAALRAASNHLRRVRRELEAVVRDQPS